MGNFSRYVKIASVFTLFLHANTAFSSDSQPDPAWDFSGKNQPSYETLWNFDGQSFDLSCRDRLDVMYEIYAVLHPEYRKFLAISKLRKNWRQSLITRGNDGLDSLNFCFYSMLNKRWRTVTTPDAKKSILFCGKLVEGIGAVAQYGAAAISELTEYALIGHSFPISIVLKANAKNPQIQLNDDVQYYLQLHLQKFMQDERTRTGDLGKIYQQLITDIPAENLTPARRKFLDDAFRRGDYHAVLDTTAPCQAA